MKPFLRLTPLLRLLADLRFKASLPAKSIWLAGWIFVTLFSVSLAQPSGKSKTPDKKTPAKSAPANAPAAERFMMPALSEADQKLLSGLRRTMTVKCEDWPLPKVLEKIRTETKVDIRLAREDLKNNQIDPMVKVSGEWKDAAAEDILAAVLGQAKLDYIMKEDHFLIVSRRKAAGPPRVTLAYNVDRLCPNAASLKQLEKAIYEVGDEDEWESLGGFAGVVADPKLHAFDHADRVAANGNQKRHAAVRQQEPVAVPAAFVCRSCVP